MRNDMPSSTLSPGSGSRGNRPEQRRSPRRRTIAPLTVVEGLSVEPGAQVRDVSGDGAYLRARAGGRAGDRVRFEFTLPTEVTRPIRAGARIVRRDEGGIGVRFDDLQAKDRNGLRAYAGFNSLDDTVVQLQRALHDLIPGNLLPLGDGDEIDRLLADLAARRPHAVVLRPGRGFERQDARIERRTDGFALLGLADRLPERTRAVYVALQDGALHYLFEGLIEQNGPVPTLLPPQRLYVTERRTYRRRAPGDASFELESARAEGGRFRFPVIDQGEGGCAIAVPDSWLVAEGFRLPGFDLVQAGARRRVEGATVRHVTRRGDAWQVGLQFEGGAAARDAFADVRQRSVRPTAWAALARMAGMALVKARTLLPKKAAVTGEAVHVARYRNDRGDRVVALLDATFPLEKDPPEVDVAVVVAPAFLKRKEIFSLLARTIVDDLKRQGKHGVVLRFDATYTVGESESNPDWVANGTPYYQWTFSHIESDMQASLAHLERRYRPAKRVLVTFSYAAPPARRYVADGGTPTVDLWIVPFGCPDCQDLFQNYLAGQDRFQVTLAGGRVEPFLLFGRMADPNPAFDDAIARGMAFPPEAQRDMGKIACPITWIVGTYDYVVTRSRVQKLLDAPGGGLREVFEMPTGHVLKTGAEAIESFKLISESISRHVFGEDREAGEPDLALHARQAEAEWARIERASMGDAQDFWKRHLFGTSDQREGYDTLVHNPDYMGFIRAQADLLEAAPGLRVADLGCGTGNLAVELAARVPMNGRPVDLTCADLVAEGLTRTEAKVARTLAGRGTNGQAVRLRTLSVDLETTRLAVIRDFVDGRLYGVQALEGRIEGLAPAVTRKLHAAYGEEIHRVLRGRPADRRRVLALCPALDDEEAEAVLELSRASRFVRGRTLPEDLAPGRSTAATARDLRFARLNFGAATPDGRLDLPAGSFDRIACSLVLSYLQDPLGVLGELHRLLAPGGILVVSSLKPNFDASKSYAEEAKALSSRSDIDERERARLLDSLREFASILGSLMELEDEGKFRFFAADELKETVCAAGFADAAVRESFGTPPTAAIVRARKGP